MDPNNLFLAANSTPCSLVSPAGLPCQNRVKSLSFMDPASGSLVSWRATVAICSLPSYLFMIANLRASFIPCKSSLKPGVIVLTFHELSVGAVVYFLLPDALFSIRLSAFHPKPHAPSGAIGP